MKTKKFLFNLSNQTLKIVQGEYQLLLGGERKFSYFGGVGFYLDYPQEGLEPQSWIIFKVSQEKVKVIYKTQGVYYQRKLFRPPGGVVEVEFGEWDQLKK